MDEHTGEEHFVQNGFESLTKFNQFCTEKFEGEVSSAELMDAIIGADTEFACLFEDWLRENYREGEG